MLPAVSSTAWAEELEPSDTYVLASDVGIAPLSALAPSATISFGPTVFTYSLDVLRSFVNSNKPFGSHYVVFSSFSYDLKMESYSTSFPAVVYYVFFFDDYTVNSNGQIEVTNLDDGVQGYVMVFGYQFAAGAGRAGKVVSIEDLNLGFVVNRIRFTSTMYEAVYRQSGFFYHFFSEPGVPGTGTILFSPYSDLPGYVDITNREGVEAIYATCFGLAVFLILNILRGFWRSARGRDT